MTVCVYTFPLNGASGFFDLALRFIQSYMLSPAGADHQMVVVCNGSPVTDEAECLFGEIPNCVLMEHDNSGYDIGAFQKVSREFPGDLMVFFGATAYIKGAGWLARMEQAFKDYGDTLYGAMGNRGNYHYSVEPHIRSTGFWLSSALFNQYPHKVTTPDGRYPFEHGRNCLTSWVKSKRRIPYVVTWDGVYPETAWDTIPNGYHQGNQSNLLCGDRLTRIPYGCDP